MRSSLCLIGLLALGLTGCPSTEINPFQTVTEQFGSQATRDDNTSSGGGNGGAAAAAFRRAMTLTINNNNAAADLGLSLMAWVNVSSIRSADQQDFLIASGYQQITHEIHVGNAYTLPPGTFVLQGEGTNGAIAIQMRRTSAGGPPTTSFQIITPDVVLLFLEPPDSCDSVAFEYTSDGFQIDPIPVVNAEGELFQGSTQGGGRKTLSQVDVYQCDPFRPGLFLKVGGGARADNEFFEGETMIANFNATPDANGNFAVITFQ